jgi:hypothetical protein
MKSSWIVVIGAALTGMAARVLAPGPIADICAIGYLFIATAAFRPLSLARVPARSQQ